MKSFLKNVWIIELDRNAEGIKIKEKIYDQIMNDLKSESFVDSWSSVRENYYKLYDPYVKEYIETHETLYKLYNEEIEEMRNNKSFLNLKSEIAKGDILSTLSDKLCSNSITKLEIPCPRCRTFIRDMKTIIDAVDVYHEKAMEKLYKYLNKQIEEERRKDSDETEIETKPAIKNISTSEFPKGVLIQSPRAIKDYLKRIEKQLMEEISAGNSIMIEQGVGSLNAEQKKAIKSTIQNVGNIEKDIEQVLINYGIYVNKDWVNIRDLKNLTEEQEKGRSNIEKVIEKLQTGGFEKNKAVTEYIKEVSYTYLNRFSAIRVMEVRGLIDEILIPRGEFGNRSFIGSRFYEVAREYCKYEMDGGLAYLLNMMFEEISEEIKMLFNTEDEYSFVTPSSTSLLKVIELLCTNIDEESWGQDEIIGWIYQYFNDKEKEDVFDRLYKKKQKIKVEDIPAATQLFTPDWIVNWIVDNNSLWTLWDK